MIERLRFSSFGNNYINCNIFTAGSIKIKIKVIVAISTKTSELGPVSYTHLDVYKRQLHHYATECQLIGFVLRLCQVKVLMKWCKRWEKQKTRRGKKINILVLTPHMTPFM